MPILAPPELPGTSVSAGMCGATTGHPNQPDVVQMLALCQTTEARSSAIAHLVISTVDVNSKEVLLVACWHWSTSPEKHSPARVLEQAIIPA